MLEVIEPQFQRDFISLLPKEVFQYWIWQCDQNWAMLLDVGNFPLTICSFGRILPEICHCGRGQISSRLVVIFNPSLFNVQWNVDSVQCKCIPGFGNVKIQQRDFQLLPPYVEGKVVIPLWSMVESKVVISEICFAMITERLCKNPAVYVF